MDLALASLFFLLLNFLSFFHSFVHSAQDEPSNSTCRPFNCGNFSRIRFPFADSRSPSCGVFFIDCQDSKPKIRSKEGTVFDVKSISNSQRSLVIQDPLVTGHLQQGVCDPLSKFKIPTFDYLYSNSSTPSLRFITCKLGYSSNLLENFKNYSLCEDLNLYLSRPGSSKDDQIYEATQHHCSSVSYSVLETPTDSQWENFDLLSAVAAGFALQWNWTTVRNCDACKKSGGVCLPDHVKDFACYCENGISDDTYCTHDSGPKRKKKRNQIIIGVTAGASGLMLSTIFYILYWFHRQRNKKHLSPSSLYLTRSNSFDHFSKQDGEKGSSTQFLNHIPALSLFTYKELEEATNSFHPSNELGNGGFGTVYYGKLRDGRAVAVKRLYESNYKRVEQFMNEIEILSRLRHKNLVNLYGCTSRHSRELLLVYEFVSNGTVSDHLHGDASKTSGDLTWPIRLRIAVETADALAYLHCVEPQIVHRDVKTNNILLDSEFRVKVADFGLSRLFPVDVTHVSTAPQGTPGYVDPEYHECYQLTDKSDVYSFGVVMVELISSKPAVDITRHRHEINLANLAISKIINHALSELVDPDLGFESDWRVRKMVTAVAELAFRCLAAQKEERPGMEEVLEVLKAIEKEGSSERKIPAEKVDVLEDDVGLLNNLPPVSPDSVTDKWASRSTTPNTSKEG